MSGTLTEGERSAFVAARNLLGLGDDHAGHAEAVLAASGGEAGAKLARWLRQKRLAEARDAIAERLR